MSFHAAAITGFAELPSTRTPEEDRTVLGQTAHLARMLAADAGLEKGEIDGLLVAQPIGGGASYWPSVVAETLGLELSFMDKVELSGAAAAGMVWRAAAAIEAGICNHVLCITTDMLEHASTMWAGRAPSRDAGFEIPYGAMPPNFAYAMIAKRHMHEFGTTSEQLAKIAVDQRTNALQNPNALFNKAALTIDEVLASKVICEPLHVFEIVSSCSGGSGIVVSRKSLAKGKNPPISLLGAGEAGCHGHVSSKRDLTSPWAEGSAGRAFAMAGLAPGQMDFAQIYDCYTIAVLMFIEAMGFAKKGQGGPFVADHDLTWTGDFPVNTNGGQLSSGQPGVGGGMVHVVEAVRQLMGRGDGRQIKGPSKGAVHGNGGIMANAVTLVMAN